MNHSDTSPPTFSSHLPAKALLEQIIQGWQVRLFPTLDYITVWESMKQFTHHRTPDTPDELWFLQHNPVYTLGQAGLESHLLTKNSIPLVKTDRGGQITYHAPGQWIVYVLCDLRRKPYWVKELVQRLEQAIIDTLKYWDLPTHRYQGLPGTPSRPGVYIDNRKIAALGIKVSRGCSYHGLALNVDLDLTPFTWINPCGYQDIETTSMKAEGIYVPMEEVQNQLCAQLIHQLGF